VSAENVAIVKSSWAGWRQSLREQMERDLADGLPEKIDAWAEQAARPDLQPLEFIDGGDVVLVCALPVGGDKPLWFNYTLDGKRIIGWDVYENEAEARSVAGLPE
jgi:hypothetical protein